MTLLDDSVRAIVREELAAIGVVAPTTVYTRARLPPGFTSAEAFAARCRALFGSSSTFKSGRAWAVPRDAWHAAVVAKRKRAATPEAASVDAVLETNPRLRLVQR